jgi:hypothetical protein
LTFSKHIKPLIHHPKFESVAHLVRIEALEALPKTKSFWGRGPERALFADGLFIQLR